MLPKKIKATVLWIDGVGYQGECEEASLPKLSRKMEDYRSAGMDGTVQIDLGQEKLEAELTMGEIVPAFFAGYAGTVDGTSIRLKGSKESDSDRAITVFEVAMRGRWSEIDAGSIKAGDATKVKYKASLSYLKYSENGTDLLEIDIPSMIFKINGVDIYAARRAACGLQY